MCGYRWSSTSTSATFVSAFTAWFDPTRFDRESLAAHLGRTAHRLLGMRGDTRHAIGAVVGFGLAVGGGLLLLLGAWGCACSLTR